MSTLETYKQEIETELDSARTKLVELKAKIRGFSDVERIQSFKDIEELEKMASEMRTKIRDLNEDMEGSLDQIKGDMDNSRNKINEAFARLNRSLV
jgi:chromosome segregation ATPase